MSESKVRYVVHEGKLVQYKSGTGIRCDYDVTIVFLDDQTSTMLNEHEKKEINALIEGSVARLILEVE